MKYLKLFEDHEELFWEISYDRYHAIFNDPDDTYHVIFNGPDIEKYVMSRWKEFTQSELRTLEEILGKLYSRREFYSPKTHLRDTFADIPGLQDFTINRQVLTNKISIIKTEDEWFYVYSGMHDGHQDKYYLCDQFDGLLACLEYLKEKGKL